MLLFNSRSGGKGGALPRNDLGAKGHSWHATALKMLNKLFRAQHSRLLMNRPCVELHVETATDVSKRNTAVKQQRG